MTKDDKLSSYFVRITCIRDELQEVDEIIRDKELVNVSLLRLPNSWNAFSVGISNWKNYLTFDKMWHAYTQEEACISTI